jgi:hypothetical protein
MSFLSNLKAVSAYKETENGAFALSSTGNDLLNAFGTLAAMRRRDALDIINKFALAYAEDRLLAMKLLFYVRDARGGCGERETFRTLVTWMANNHPEDIKVNLALVAEYGRWDDLYAFVGTKLEKDALDIMKAQFEQDMKDLYKGKPVSILGKWLKSENTSSAESRQLGKKTREHFGLTAKEYRQKLSMLRKAIDVVETKMSAQNWSDISYEAVPSYAAKNYADAFAKHDEDRYNEFLNNVKAGTAKINAATLFPYDLVRSYTNGRRHDVDDTVEAQWKALPNYVTDEKKFLVMADTSGSMTGLPMDTSVGLAIYFAERNTGAYHGKFITFTDTPRFFDLPDSLSLRERVNLVMDYKNVGYNTNLEAAFELVLKSAIKGKVPQEELPEAILVISDMEIDQFGSRSQNTTFTAEMEQRFADAGYKMPTLVYWNVNARQDTFHAETNDNVRFISGSSAAIFKGLCEHMGFSARELMLNVLNSERYSRVKIAE